MWEISTPEGPLVLPMAYGHDGDYLFLHGAVANHLLGSGEGQEVCITVTHLDGLVMARTPFHNSMNYRSVVVRGQGTAHRRRRAQGLRPQAGDRPRGCQLGCRTTTVAVGFAKDPGSGGSAGRGISQGPQWRPNRRTRRHRWTLVGWRGAGYHSLRIPAHLCRFHG